VPRVLSYDGPDLDWSNSRPGPPGLDVAMTGLIVCQVAVARPELGEVLAAFVGTYLSSTSNGATAWVDDAGALRRSDPHMTAEELDQMQRSGELVRSLCRQGG
jgi:hypothetical protein